MPQSLRIFLHAAVLLVIACVAPAGLAAEPPADPSAPTLTDAQRKLRSANQQLERAQKDANRAQRELRQAKEDLETAQREVERKTKAVTDADEQLAEAQRQQEAARAVIEKLYDAQQR
jgi:septal ring factor EnvC (AmiA/AmiB activator)